MRCRSFDNEESRSAVLYLDVCQHKAPTGSPGRVDIQHNKVDQLPAVQHRLKWMPPVCICLQHTSYLLKGPCDKDSQMIHCIPGDMLAGHLCGQTQCIDQGWQAGKDKAKARMAEANGHSGTCIHSIHCERVFQPMQGMERTSICTERSVWGSVRVSVLDTLVHSASGPKPPRAADALCGRHTRSSCNSLHLDSFPLSTGITLSSSQEMLKHTQ